MDGNFHSKKKEKAFLIGICGGSASGKTSVANIIWKRMGIDDCILYSMDNYYKHMSDEDRKNISEYNFDHPNAFDFDLLYTHLCQLIEGKSIEMPVYDFTTSSRLSHTIKVNSAPLIIFEGILSFYDPRICNLMDMKIFVDTDDDVRLARRVYRDIRERGRTIAKVLERYMKFVKIAFDEYIKPTRRKADVIIPRGMENTVAIELLSQNLKWQLNNIFYKRQDNNKLIMPSELVETKSQILNEVVFTFENHEDLKILKQIIEDIMSGNRIAYYELFFKEMNKSLIDLTLKNINMNDDILIFTTKHSKQEIDEKFTKSDKTKSTYFFFKTSILNESEVEKVDQFLSLVPASSEINILSVFLSPKFAESLISKFSNISLKYVTLFLTSSFESFEKVCGVTGDNVFSDTFVFSEENFEDYFPNKLFSIK